jgi:heterodisulfide reductase subunit A-like polyferredoxin
MGNNQSTGQVKGHTASYIPAIKDFSLQPSNSKKNAKILVIGGGCAGLGASWHLNRCGFDVTLYESENYIGGHANTINGKLSSVRIGVRLFT